MKRILILAALMMSMMLCTATAEAGWLIQDSDTRALTAEELWQWDYESLCYIEHEIYARHGYRFSANNAYGEYFRAQEWYTPNSRSNIDGCYAEMSELEWQNIRLIADVQQQMLNQGTMNLEKGRSVWTSEPTVPAIVFTKADFRRGQSIAVYSAPSTKAWRGANNKAKVSTNGDVWAAGWDGDWLLIYYETSKGSVRAGYISGSKFKDDMSAYGQLEFAGTQATVTEKCSLTDDITRLTSSITKISAGKQVVYLAPCFIEGNALAYIETKVSGKTVRGFIPMDCLDTSAE